MLDIVIDVSKENGEKRGTSLPIWGNEYIWWTEAVQAKLLSIGKDQKDLEASKEFGAPAVSRAISREKPVYHVIMAIAAELELPPPVILPESEAEALHLAAQWRLFRSDRHLEQIKSGTAKPPTGGQPPKRRGARRARKHQRE